MAGTAVHRRAAVRTGLRRSAARVVPLLSAAVLTACTAFAPQPVPEPTSAPPTLGGTGTGVVARDIAYADDSSGPQWNPATLDLYRPSAGPAPLVVILPDGRFDKSAVAYPLIAQRLSALGVAVASMNRGLRSPPNAYLTAGGSKADLLHLLRQGNGQLDCAVSTLLSRAGEYGIDPGRILLLGHGSGAGLAATAGLGARTDPFPGCAARPVQWTPSALVLWDGDWLLTQSWDGWGADLGTQVMPLLTPWSRIGAEPQVPVDIVVTAQLREPSPFRVCLRDKPDVLAHRDPTGRITALLESSGALGDACVTAGEASDTLAAALAAAGHPTSTTNLAAPGTSRSVLAREDLGALVELLADRTQEPATGDG